MPGKYQRHFDVGLCQQLYILYINARWLLQLKPPLSWQTKVKDAWKLILFKHDGFHEAKVPIRTLKKK